MNIRNLVLLSVFVGIGAVLHAVVPGLVFGMKPDMMLTMMFLGILVVPKLPYVVLISLVTGMISALTTGIPGGAIANMIDKPITALVFFGLFLFFREKLSGNVTAISLTAVGTIVSGYVFLSVLLLFLGVEGSFLLMFTTIVLPTAAINAVLMGVLYPVIQTISRRSQLIPEV